jgi:Hormone-sensitive lipase (HSL) N-terminus
MDLLIPLLDQTLEDLRCRNFDKINSTIIKKIYIQSAKLYIGDFILYAAFKTPIDDVFYQAVDSDAWSLLLNCYSYHEFADNQKVVKAYKSFYNYVAIGNAMLSQRKETDMAITKMFKQGLYGTYYLLNKQKRIDQMELINANPDMNLARELWNMLENKWVRQGMEIIMPSIKINKKIFIPMTDVIMTRENISNLPDFTKKI